MYQAALEAVTPVVEGFGPTWVLVSCGFESHREDLIGDLGLAAGDFADLTRRWTALGRPILFLEGGYDTDAIAESSAACAAAFVGIDTDAPRTTGGPGLEVVKEVARLIE